MSRTFRMLAGCVLPLLLIFFLPLLGISEGVTLLAFLVLMFGCHLLMMHGHGHGGGNRTHHEEGDDHANA